MQARMSVSQLWFIHLWLSEGWNCSTRRRNEGIIWAYLHKEAITPFRPLNCGLCKSGQTLLITSYLCCLAWPSLIITEFQQNRQKKCLNLWRWHRDSGNIEGILHCHQSDREKHLNKCTSQRERYYNQVLIIKHLNLSWIELIQTPRT